MWLFSGARGPTPRFSAPQPGAGPGSLQVTGGDADSVAEIVVHVEPGRLNLIRHGRIMRPAGLKIFSAASGTVAGSHVMRTSGFCGWAAMVAAAAMLAGASGCATRGSDAGGWGRRGPANAASRLLTNIDISAVRPVAERAFREYFQIDPETSSGSVFVSRPVEITEGARPERLRDALRPSANRHRQVAELYLIQDGPHVRLRCRVQTQRLDTAERAAFARVRGDDRPTDTPIDRQGALSSSPQEEWSTVGRDRRVEQAILAAIQSDLAAAIEPER